jgi:hypothetical protein
MRIEISWSEHTRLTDEGEDVPLDQREFVFEVSHSVPKRLPFELHADDP